MNHWSPSLVKNLAPLVSMVGWAIARAAASRPVAMDANMMVSG
jgi:hypothetical protein